MRKSRGVAIFGSVLAALQFLAAASALADVIGKQTFGLFVIAVGALQVGWAFYQQEQVVPVIDVAAYQNSKGMVVAGPAAGATNGTHVVVEPGTTMDRLPGPDHRRGEDEFGNA